MELGEHAAGKLQQPGKAEIDARLSEHVPADDELRLARNESRPADAVAPDVHQSAAVELRA